MCTVIMDLIALKQVTFYMKAKQKNDNFFSNGNNDFETFD
jgi:hypothetical protein